MSFDLKPVLAMDCPIEFRTMPDCACPYEHWHLMSLAGSCLDVHLEEDGSAHFRFDGDGIEVELTVDGCTDLGEARQRAFAWVCTEVMDFTGAPSA